ncbi:unnamed protein product [Ectocarpus sp. 13 AM-2016]
MPDKGDEVLYYGDGHVLSMEAEAKAGYSGVWGSDPPRPGTVQQHTVKSISYHQGGSSRRAKGAQPFATIELEPTPVPRSFEELGLLPPTEPFGKLNRLLKKAVKAMRERADVAHFLVPVSRTIYPDYYDVISEPMDLNKLWKRCSACRYRSVEDFKRELALVASNCRLYCQDKFPTLPPAADAAVNVGMETLDEPKLAAELGKTVEDGKRLEALWNKHMSAAISASPELATMPGMQKLARQLGFDTGTAEEDDIGRGEQESDEDDDYGQPDTASIARQVFFDKLVGIKYGTPDDGEKQKTDGSDSSDVKKKPPKLDETPEARSPTANGVSPTPPSPGGGAAAAAAATPQASPSATSPSASSPPPAIKTADATSSGATAVVAEGEASPSSAATGAPGAAGAAGAEPMEVDSGSTEPKTAASRTSSSPSAAAVAAAAADAAGSQPRSPSTAASPPAAATTAGTPDTPPPGEHEKQQSDVAADTSKEEGAGGREAAAAAPVVPAVAPAGVLRVSMRLSNEMPEFVVVTSKYDEAMTFSWRSEMHIQMAFMEEPGEPPRIFEGTLVGVKPKDPRTQMMPWECLMVEWDDEAGMNTVNPWEVEAVSAATAAARRRAPGMPGVGEHIG